MTFHLARKELAQHGWSLLALTVLVGFCSFLAYAVIVLKGESGTPFEAMRICMMVFVPLLAMALAHFLVVREYRDKTQLFLEVLPLSRLHMLLTKYLLGLLVVAGYIGAMLGLASALGLSERKVTPGLLAIITLRSLAFGFFIYTFFFMMGLLGRYRVGLMILMFLAMVVVDSMTAIELERIAPVVCLDTTFAFESNKLPIRAVSVTTGIGVLFLGLTILLGLVREGEVATRLGERMSHREKVFIAAGTLALMMSITVYDQRREKEPYRLRDAYQTSQDGFVVEIAPRPNDDHQQDRDLANRLSRELASVRDYLGLDYSGPAMITLRRNLNPEIYESGELTQTEGLLFRANYRHTEFDPHAFTAWVIRQYLLKATRNRAEFEPKRWVLDGFPEFWVTAKSRVDTADTLRTQHLMRALYARPQGLEAEDLRRWNQVRDAHGAPLAESLASVGLHALFDYTNETRFKPFVQGMLGVGASKDFRVRGYERRHAQDRLFKQAGLSSNELVDLWNAAINRGVTRYAKELAALPRLECHFAVESASEITRRIGIELKATPPLPDSARVTLTFSKLEPFAVWVPPILLERRHYMFSNIQNQQLPDSFNAGERVYLTVVTRSPELGCDIISGWQRLELP